MGRKNNRKRKNKKNKKNKSTNNKEKLSVTIVTPTMDSRTDYLEVLIQCILEQKYNNIIEWIIVDGSQNDDHKLREPIEKFRKKYPDLPEIVFLEPPPDNNKTIGALRNLYNKHCKGDIIVCMDDDDYYPPTRVSHCVEKISNSHLEIGACAGLCIYSIEFQKIYEWKRFHLNQGGNASMAYTRNYAQTHLYEPVACGEEKTFVKNYMGYNTKPEEKNEQTMIQFDKEHALLSIAHRSTYKKSKLFYDNEMRPKDKKFVYNSTFTLGSYVTNTKILKMYKQLFKKDDFENEDVTIIQRRMINPLYLSKPFMESESKQIHALGKYLVEKGKKVVVYTDIVDEENRVIDGIKMQNETITTIDNVMYKHMYTIDSRQRFKHIIAIDKDALKLIGLINISYKYLHFVNYRHVNTIDNDILNNIDMDTYIYRSKYMYDSLLENNTYFKKLLQTSIKTINIPLGINNKLIDLTKKSLESTQIIRNNFRLCYTNSYNQGLLPILQYIYPELKKAEPRIELHLYGAIHEHTIPTLKTELEKYIDQSGIVDHGLCNMEDIIKEKLTSSFHLYFTGITKYDSLSIKESIYCECIPVISNAGIFKDLPGCHFNFDPEKVQSYKNVANVLSSLVKNDAKINELRSKVCSNKQSIPTVDQQHVLWDKILFSDE